MPQEGRRTMGFRPFITCDDPRGVVECGTIRKPKTIPTQKGEYDKRYESHRRKHKNVNIVGGEDLSSKEMVINSASFRHLEVSRGAQKLSHVVNSWPDGHGRSNQKDITEDLRKGAPDLEESLSNLTRLQESSSYKSGSTKKSGFNDDLEMGEKAFVCTMQDTRYHGLRISGSSRDSYENKRVIRDGAERKNVLSNPSSEEASDDRILLDSSDLLSTCSSQSSAVHSNNFVSPESFLPSTSSRKKKEKRLSLIAKLKGVEDAFLRSFPYTFRKNGGDGEKVLNQKKPAFDHDSPRERKHENDPERSGSRRMKIEQLIEAVKSKGLHKNSLLNGVKPSSNNDKWDCVDRRPAIVIMKPVRFSCLNSEQPIIPKSRAEVDEEMLLKMRLRTNLLAQIDGSETPNFNENLRKAKEDQGPIRNSSRRLRCGDTTILKGKPELKDFIAKETASSLEKSRPQKMNGSTRKRTTKCKSHLQSHDGNELTILKLESSRGSNNTKLDMLRSATIEYRRKGSKRITEDTSELVITDYVNDDHSFPSETSLSSGNRKNILTALMVTNDCGTTDVDTERRCSTSAHNDSSKGSTAKKSLKALLLSSPLFISRVEELFDLKVDSNTDLIQQIHYDRSARVLLDCANELIELHGYQLSRVRLPLPRTHEMSYIKYYYTSLDQLLVEVCDGIEALRRYGEAHGDIHSIDSSLLLVEGDLSRGMLCGVWDFGWTSARFADEIEEITRLVDELVFGGLIKEILVDLTL